MYKIELWKQNKCKYFKRILHNFIKDKVFRLSKTLKMNKKDAAENTAHSKIISSVLLETNCTQIIVSNVSSL